MYANRQREVLFSGTSMTYDGEWREGMKHGQGTLYIPNGDVLVVKGSA